jgi:hypothetical protein
VECLGEQNIKTFETDFESAHTVVVSAIAATVERESAGQKIITLRKPVVMQQPVQLRSCGDEAAMNR